MIVKRAEKRERERAKKKKNRIGIINKEVESIGLRSILSDEIVRKKVVFFSICANKKQIYEPIQHVCVCVFRSVNPLVVNSIDI